MASTAGGLHRAVDRRRSDVERAAEDEGKAQDVVDLVRVVGTPRRDHRVLAHGVHDFRQDLRHRVREREYERILGHLLDHVAAQNAGRGQAEEHVGARDGFIERAQRGVLRVLALVGIHVGLAPGVDHAFDVDQHHRFDRQPEINQQIKAGEARGTAAGRHHPDVIEALADQFEAVLQGRGDDDGRAVLVVVEHGDVEAFLQRGFHLEAVRRLDVLEVDRAESRRERGDHFDEPRRVGLVELDVESVDVGEAFEQHRLAFHHRFRSQRADVAQAQHRRAVGNDADQVAAGGIGRGGERIGEDFLAGIGDPGRIGLGQVEAILQRLGRRDRELAGRRQPVVTQRTLFQGRHVGILNGRRPSCCRSR